MNGKTIADLVSVYALPSQTRRPPVRRLLLTSLRSGFVDDGRGLYSAWRGESQAW